MNKINIAIVGVGNCASSFIQTLEAYKQGIIGNDSPGLIFPKVGNYSLNDIKIVAAYDINKNKVGLDVSEAIAVDPNCTTLYLKPDPMGVVVLKSPVLDGRSDIVSDLIPVDEEQIPVDVVASLEEAKANVILNLLPVGSSQAVSLFAMAACKLGIAFVNCMPEPIATNKNWVEIFEKHNAIILGDDMKSQIGSTAIHRTLIEFCQSRGIAINNSYQLNFGGNTDFLNMQDKQRKKTKKFTKTIAIKRALKEDTASDASAENGETNISIGPSDYVPFLNDRKIAYIRIEGEQLLGAKIDMEMRLSVEDSPNAAGIIINAVRVAKLALDRKMKGVVSDPCALLFKNAPCDIVESKAKDLFESFIEVSGGN